MEELNLRSPQDFHEHVSCHRERAGNDARPENSFVANKIAIRSLPRLVCLLSVIILCLQAIPLRAADSRHLATVPALGVLAGGQLGTVHYVVSRSIQTLDKWDQPFNSMK